MKLDEIPFDDDAFKACVLASGAENAEDVTELHCRKQKIKSAAGVEHLTNLKLLDLTRNEITKIDLSKNIKLEEIFLGNNELSSLDISGCNELIYLEVFINELDEIDLSNNPILEGLVANKNDLEAIDISKNSELLDLRLSGNSLSKIDVSANEKLERLDLEKNPLSDELKSVLEKMEGTTVSL